MSIQHTLVHHVALTVTDMARSLAFYQKIGFEKFAEFGPKVLTSNGTVMIGMEACAPAADRFDEKRVGLDHVSFQVASREDLETAVTYFNQQGIRHGGITDLVDFGIAVLPFYDPDGIALEFTAAI
ncbi:MAG: VOC family protein [Anaerolineae bacterium]|nr:VOC family protein [Anaerolineae bacterium]